tara:strand:+ start:504 stop:752 length:249 start_codon:yes stop_codon:yes gene_type:complete
MKVGDLVQQGTRVVKFKGMYTPKKSRRVGIVMEIHEIPVEMLNGRSDWAATLGRTVDVLWDNGKITEGFAENSLEVISDEGR